MRTYRPSSQSIAETRNVGARKTSTQESRNIRKPIDLASTTVTVPESVMLLQSLLIYSLHAPHHRFVAVVIADMSRGFHSLRHRCGEVRQTFRNLIRQCSGISRRNGKTILIIAKHLRHYADRSRHNRQD